MKASKAPLISLIISTAIVATVFASPVYAQSLGDGSDLGGISLSMNSIQAKGAAEKKFPGRPVVMFSSTLSAEGFSREAVTGFSVLISKDGANVSDRVTALTNPNPGAGDVFLVEKYTRYIAQMQGGLGDQKKVSGELVTEKAAMESLIAKYGQPKKRRHDLAGIDEYYWFANATAPNAKKCPYSSWIDFPFFYEDGANITPVESIKDREAVNFSNLLNGSPHPIDQSGCGTVVWALFDLEDPDPVYDQAPRYISSMVVELSNLDRGSADILAFRNRFFADAQNHANTESAKHAKTKPDF